MSQRASEKNPENLILAKDNDSCKSSSSAMKLELYLYHVMIIHIPNLRSVSQKMEEKSPENLILGKGGVCRKV